MNQGLCRKMIMVVLFMWENWLVVSWIMTICMMEYYITIKKTLWKIFSKNANYSQYKAKGEKALTRMQNYAFHVESSKFCYFVYIYTLPYRAGGKKYKNELDLTLGGPL